MTFFYFGITHRLSSLESRIFQSSLGVAVLTMSCYCLDCIHLQISPTQQ